MLPTPQFYFTVPYKFSHHFGTALRNLRVHREVILFADLTDGQQTDLSVMLEEWQDLLGSDFSMSLEALRQGWDYPPLQQVLQGHITRQGAWEGESPH
jgi:uncharacterized Zn finger protein